MQRAFLRRLSGWLWQFLWFRLLLFVCLRRGWFTRAIGLYTPFWTVWRMRMTDEGSYDLANQGRKYEALFERYARVYGL